MKKTFIFAFALVVALASCGNKAEQSANSGSAEVEATAETPDAEEVMETVTSALAANVAQGDVEKVKATLTTIQIKYQDLVQSGKLEEAKKYAVEVQKYINDNAEQIKSMTGNNQAIATLIDGIKALPTDASTTAEQAITAVQKSADALLKVEAGKVNDAVNAEVDKAKQKAADAVNAEVDKAKQKAADAVNAEVEKAKQKAGDAAKKAVGDAASKLLGK